MTEQEVEQFRRTAEKQADKEMRRDMFFILVMPCIMIAIVLLLCIGVYEFHGFLKEVF